MMNNHGSLSILRVLWYLRSINWIIIKFLILIIITITIVAISIQISVKWSVILINTLFFLCFRNKWVPVSIKFIFVTCFFVFLFYHSSCLIYQILILKGLLNTIIFFLIRHITKVFYVGFSFMFDHCSCFIFFIVIWGGRVMIYYSSCIYKRIKIVLLLAISIIFV